MIDWSLCPEVESHEDKLSGALVFKGTRISVITLFENLESGASIDEILEWFPGLSKKQISFVLEFSKAQLFNLSA